MKTVFAFLLSVTASLGLQAQSYAITTHSLSAVGTSSGDGYALRGAVGQPAAGAALTGAGYAVTGGILPLPQAVPSADGPELMITAAPNGQVAISWSPATAGSVLQQSPTLQPTAWANAPSGAQNPVTVPVSPAIRFYRVFKP